MLMYPSYDLTSRKKHLPINDNRGRQLISTMCRMEIPVVAEGAERAGHQGPGAVLVVALTNATGKESSKKTSDFK